MSGFITKAACSGHRPTQFAGYAGYQRSELVARLLKERSIARFVVAPVGYGKTSLLVDYAETMFSWVHVFWVNGQSPCFIRDLDDGIIASGCKSVDTNVRLVVFDDVPVLSAERAVLFSRQIDELLAAQCEVIVACTPRCDVLGKLQRDRLRIGPRDLLLDDAEVDGARSADERLRVPASQVPDAQRVAALAWGGADAGVPFVKASLKEQMPADLVLSMTSMYVMRQGSIEDLGAIGVADLELVAEMTQEYPHLGFDPETGRFLTPELEAEDLKAALRGVLDKALDASPFERQEELIWAWANLLAAQEGSCGRACNIVRVLCPRAKRLDWLVRNAVNIVRCGRFYEGLLLVNSMQVSYRDSTVGGKQTRDTFEAVCRMMLGDEGEATRLAKKVAFGDAEQPARICSLLVLARCASDAVRQKAQAVLGDSARAFADGPVEVLSPWAQIAVSWSLVTDVDALAVWWGRLFEGNAQPMVLGLTASWLFSAIAGRHAAGEEFPMPQVVPAVAAVERYVRSALASGSDERQSYFMLSAGLALEEAHMKGVPLAEGPLPSATLLALRHVEFAVAAQKARFARECAAGKMQASALPGGDGLQVPGRVEVAEAKMVRNVPVLKLKMFGRFEVIIGDVPVDERAFSRKHVRQLLLVLASNLGRDLSRDSLAKMLWPDATEHIARKNLYTTWSRLRSALSLTDGSCPYLLRHQYGYSLDERHVRCDVARLNEICRELLFGRPDFRGWAALYTELDRDFANELLPSEDDEGVVSRIRSECRSRLVDALVSATQSVIDGGNLQLAIWFGRSAIGHDETREDAYVALMRAQVANGQRTAAIMTYHQCRRVLADKLGVDPSPETNAFYESLLDSE